MSKFKYIMLALAVLFFFVSVSCIKKTIEAKGKIDTGRCEVESFAAISVSQGIELNYTPSDDISILYEVPETVLPYIEIKSDGGVLYCDYKEDFDIKMNDMKTVVHVAAPEVSDFIAQTGAVINVPNELVVEHLSVSSSGDATITMHNITAATIDFEATSGGAISVKAHKVQKFEAVAMSGAKIFYQGDTVTNAALDSSSGASLHYMAHTHDMDVDASSQSNIMLVGTYDNIEVTASSGSVITSMHSQIKEGHLSASSNAQITLPKATKGEYMMRQNSGGTISILE